MACTSLLLAAAPTTLRPVASPPPLGVRFPSEEALRRYSFGRLLEEQGETAAALDEYYHALLADPGAASVALRISDLSARLGEASRSLEFAERALRLDPENARGRWLEGGALFNLGRAAEALGPLEQAVRADSGDAEMARTLGRVADQLDRHDVALRAYQRAVFIDDEDAESWFQVALMSTRLGRLGAADSALAEAARLNPLRPGLFFLEGWIRESQGRAREALDLYRKHLGIHAGDQATRRRMVNLLVEEKRFAEAYREAGAVTRARPDDPEALQVEADLAFLASRSDEGERALERLRAAAPEDPDRVARSVTVLARHHREREGVALAADWAKKRPADYRGQMTLARALSLSGQTEAALEHTRRAVELAPDSLPPRVLLGRLHQQARRFAGAESVWVETRARFPGAEGVALDLAYCREQLGDLEGAERAVREVLGREPRDATALNFLGYLLADHNRKLEEAHDMIQQAVDQEPDNGAFIDSLGWIYYRLGRLRDAREQLERAARLTGGDPVVLEHLGDVYKDLKLLDLARDQYRRCLERDGSNTRVRAKLSAIR